MPFFKRVINCTTHERSTIELTPEEETIVLAREAKGIADHAAEDAEKAARQASIDKLKASVDPDIQDLVKAMGW